MIITQPNAILQIPEANPYKFIEKVGRICYKTEDKITEDSHLGFLQRLLERRHLAMLEHGYVFVRFNAATNLKQMILDLMNINGIDRIMGLDIFKYINVEDRYLSASFTALIYFYEKLLDLYYAAKEAPHPFYYWMDLYKLLQKQYPEVFWRDYHIESSNLDDIGMVLFTRDDFIRDVNTIPDRTVRDAIFFKLLPHTVLFICDRGVSHEIVRHRPCAFGQESTRYCNYKLGKYGNEITVIEPFFYADPARKEDYDDWKESCEFAEKKYMRLMARKGASAQEARDVLPNSLKTEIFVTATESEWQHIINLRYHGLTGTPHPQMKQVMDIAYPQLVEASAGRLN